MKCVELLTLHRHCPQATKLSAKNVTDYKTFQGLRFIPQLYLIPPPPPFSNLMNCPLRFYRKTGVFFFSIIIDFFCMGFAGFTVIGLAKDNCLLDDDLIVVDLKAAAMGVTEQNGR